MDSTTTNLIAPCRDSRGRFITPPPLLVFLAEYCRQQEEQSTYSRWLARTDHDDDEWAAATPAEREIFIAAILRQRDVDLERWNRQQADAVPKGRVGVLPGEPPPRVWVPILSGQEPDAAGKIFCTSPAHDDRNVPNMHVYSDHVFCFKCEFGTKMLGFAATVLGIGQQEGTAWRMHSTQRPAVKEHLFNLGLLREEVK
jgi:hypothetical protein